MVPYEDLELQPMANRDKKLKKKSEGSRPGPLTKLMIEGRKNFIKKNERNPPAKELWDIIPVGACVEGKDNNFIYWRYPLGRRDKTSFKGFKNTPSKTNKGEL